MSPPQRLTILITGCSPGGMGAALAVAFHKSGHHVFATARNSSKLQALSEQGIETLPLDITSPASIESAVSAVTAALPPSKGLDILINNAAANYTMPVADVSLPAARELFDVNVWAQIAVTQAFLPLILRSTNNPDPKFQPIIANHTSVGSVTALPFQGIYNASKAALAMLTSTLRMELAPFDIRVVDLKTAGVKTNLIANSNFNRGTTTNTTTINDPLEPQGDRLPPHSIFPPSTRPSVEHMMSQANLVERGVSPEEWATEVVALLLQSSGPPLEIWKGESAALARMAAAVPCGLAESVVKRVTGLGVVEGEVRRARGVVN
ncbi:uncharacterized protein C8A04DRAFT_14164 [Dichotomopilus funicola]|uniref:NAD(P)-binding protein n=1 Tax=Dichotomopilus funicola TaxID=1934379 RepID=A0AAN6ZL65_9PEZI|nr:hypothetical protein C8A04DRAFT_14164 [Dichotomopilus funicola]